MVKRITIFFLVEDHSLLLSSGSGAMEDYGGLLTTTSLIPDVEYTVACNHYYTDRIGTVSSPLMPVGYLDYDVDCSWTIDGGKCSWLLD